MHNLIFTYTHRLLFSLLRTIQCTICQNHRDILCTRPSSALREKEKLSWNKHVYEVKLERSEYYQRRESAVREPRSYHSWIIDGADEGCFEMPSLAVQTKDECNQVKQV